MCAREGINPTPAVADINNPFLYTRGGAHDIVDGLQPLATGSSSISGCSGQRVRNDCLKQAKVVSAPSPIVIGCQMQVFVSPITARHVLVTSLDPLRACSWSGSDIFCVGFADRFCGLVDWFPDCIVIWVDYGAQKSRGGPSYPKPPPDLSRGARAVVYPALPVRVKARSRSPSASYCNQKSYVGPCCSP